MKGIENTKEMVHDIIMNNIEFEDLNEVEMLEYLNKCGCVDDLAKFIHNNITGEQYEGVPKGEMPEVNVGDVFYQRRMDYHFIIRKINEVDGDRVTVRIVKDAATQDQKSWDKDYQINNLQNYLRTFNYVNIMLT